MQTKPTRFAALVLVSPASCQRTETPEAAAPPGAPNVVTGTPDAGTGDVNARIQSILGEPAKYEQAFTSFQKAVAAHDSKTVAALVAYPFTANVGGRKVKLPDAAAFVRHYDVIVTPTIANVITRQRYADLFVNADGVMFGQGEAWLNGVCKDDACKDFDVRVIAIQSTR
ncbi:hypothetical protein COCOR_04723 [Corallococcus coralloides DSM 2259]|uniref:Uncharacterized protein n=1 Tax=Corallococcus coralloides (strain ATCC 25202 / DSM 2259 / NBRC 100086 / M2) TaxID=1144275 RepID=H8MJJ3_CORCM|nr:hypothetical protein [Corallococcus coralloides]AFE05989.1 hypothetical protein COCOR_04723 [Corallococcus coralloides DSM 2259]